MMGIPLSRSLVEALDKPPSNSPELILTYISSFFNPLPQIISKRICTNLENGHFSLKKSEVRQLAENAHA